MAETLEFNDIYQEVKGSMNDGRLRLSRQGIIFKNSKTGKVDNIQAGELTEGIWRRVALGHGLKLLTKNGHVYKYDGFRESVRCPVAINSLLMVPSCLILIFQRELGLLPVITVRLLVWAS